MFSDDDDPSALPILEAADEAAARPWFQKRFKEMGGLPRLARHLGDALSKTAVIGVIDNSASTMNDGGTLYRPGKWDTPCTIWEEIVGSATSTATVLRGMGVPTAWALLNPTRARSSVLALPADCPVGDDGTIGALDAFLRPVTPQGGTMIAERLAALAPYFDRLLETVDTVCVLIITDGMPGKSGDTMAGRGSGLARQLEQMAGSGQIRVCVRLCTDDLDVMKFWYGFDDLCDDELSVNVIDDFESERERVGRHNRWIPYTHAVHTCCEIGIGGGFDAINNRACTPRERAFLEPLIGSLSSSLWLIEWVLILFVVGIAIALACNPELLS